MNYLFVALFRSSFGRLRNLSTDFTVVLLKNSTISVRFWTSCCNRRLSISAAYITSFNRFVSSSAISLSSVTFITLSFDLFIPAAIVCISEFNYSITVVKLVSGSNSENIEIVLCLPLFSTLLVEEFDSGARAVSNDIPTSRHSSL